MNNDTTKRRYYIDRASLCGDGQPHPDAIAEGYWQEIYLPRVLDMTGWDGAAVAVLTCVRRKWSTRYYIDMTPSELLAFFDKEGRCIIDDGCIIIYDACVE